MDIFLTMNQILLKSGTAKHTIFCIFNRTSFLFNFISILANGESNVSIEPICRTNVSMQSTRDNFFHRGYPLLSQKVFHIDYFNTLK